MSGTWCESLDDLQRMFRVRSTELVQVLLNQLEALRHASGHRGFDSVSVALELLDNELRDE